MIAPAAKLKHWTEKKDLFRDAASRRGYAFRQAMEQFYADIATIAMPQPAPVRSEVEDDYGRRLKGFVDGGFLSYDNAGDVIRTMRRIEQVYGSTQLKRFYFVFLRPIMADAYYHLYHREADF